MKTLIGTLLFTWALVTVIPASAQTLDDLARTVREAATTEARINEEREARFVRERDNQSQLLADARAELASENGRADRLRVEYDQNERALADLETPLAERIGNLGELFGTVRQAANDLHGIFRDSLVSARFPGRAEWFDVLADARKLPNITELERFWLLMQEVQQVDEQVGPR